MPYSLADAYIYQLAAITLLAFPHFVCKLSSNTVKSYYTMQQISYCVPISLQFTFMSIRWDMNSRVKIKIYSVFLLLLSWTPQLSWDILVDKGFLCNKSTVLGGVIQEIPCITSLHSSLTHSLLNTSATRITITWSSVTMDIRYALHETKCLLQYTILTLQMWNSRRPTI